MINGTMCFLRHGWHTLFLHRMGGAGDIHHGWYVPPGGHTERGERSVDCITREFREETGLNLITPQLRVTATFYNKGRILGGKKNPEDWSVDVYDATDFEGILREEHEKAKLVWVPDNKLAKVRMYEGDRRILDLMREREGVFEAIVQYSGKYLKRFEYDRVF